MLSICGQNINIYYKFSVAAAWVDPMLPETKQKQLARKVYRQKAKLHQSGQAKRAMTDGEQKDLAGVVKVAWRFRERVDHGHDNIAVALTEFEPANLSDANTDADPVLCPLPLDYYTSTDGSGTDGSEGYSSGVDSNREKSGETSSDVVTGTDVRDLSTTASPPRKRVKRQRRNQDQRLAQENQQLGLINRSTWQLHLVGK